MNDDAVSLIIPAFNEEDRIAETLLAVQELAVFKQIIVVDDGSQDHTARKASQLADMVIRHPQNKGKAEAIASGLKQATEPVLCWLDADLGASARHAMTLLMPVFKGEADMTVALLPTAHKSGGFGIVKWTATKGTAWLTGVHLKAPLSGQRVLYHSMLEDLLRFPSGFGLEVGLNVRLLRCGYRLMEVPVPFMHRETSRNWQGFLHRGQEWVDIVKELFLASREHAR